MTTAHVGTSGNGSATPVAPAPVPFDQFTAVNHQTLTAAARANARLMRDMLAMQRRLLDFAARRIDCDIETAGKIADCSDAPEMVIVAQTFCAQAVSDYAAEATEMMQAATRLGADAARDAGGERRAGD